LGNSPPQTIIRCIAEEGELDWARDEEANRLGTMPDCWGVNFEENGEVSKVMNYAWGEADAS